MIANQSELIIAILNELIRQNDDPNISISQTLFDMVCHSAAEIADLAEYEKRCELE